MCRGGNHTTCTNLIVVQRDIHINIIGHIYIVRIADRSTTISRRRGNNSDNIRLILCGQLITENREIRVPDKFRKFLSKFTDQSELVLNRHIGDSPFIMNIRRQSQERVVIVIDIGGQLNKIIVADESIASNHDGRSRLHSHCHSTGYSRGATLGSGRGNSDFVNARLIESLGKRGERGTSNFNTVHIPGITGVGGRVAHAEGLLGILANRES